MSEKNPFLEPENYLEGYQKSIDKLRNSSKAVELDKLCFHTFTSDSGKKLVDECKNRFLIPGLYSPRETNAEMVGAYFEGFKEGIRMLMINCVKSHEERVKGEAGQQ